MSAALDVESLLGIDFSVSLLTGHVQIFMRYAAPSGDFL
jgi:hypothetical protein